MLCIHSRPIRAASAVRGPGSTRTGTAARVRQALRSVRRMTCVAGALNRFDRNIGQPPVRAAGAYVEAAHGPDYAAGSVSDGGFPKRSSELSRRDVRWRGRSVRLPSALCWSRGYVGPRWVARTAGEPLTGRRRRVEGAERFPANSPVARGRLILARVFGVSRARRYDLTRLTRDRVTPGLVPPPVAAGRAVPASPRV
jgi:hypothetical protein